VGKLGGRLEPLLRIGNVVVCLIPFSNPLKDSECLLDGGFGDLDLLKTPGEGAVFLKILPVFIVGGRSDAAEFSGDEGRLQDITGIHRSAGDGAGADDIVDFIDEEDHVLLFLELGDDPFEPFLEVAAEAGSGQDRPHVQGEDSRPPEKLRNLPGDDELGKPLGDRGLSHTGLADVDRIILEAAAEDLDRPFKDILPADQGVHLTGPCPGGQLNRVVPEKLVRFFFGLPDLFPVPFAGSRVTLPDPVAGEDRDAVGDVVEEREPADSLPLEVEGGVGFLLIEDRDEDIPQIQHLFLGGGGMPGGPFKDALKSEGLKRPCCRGDRIRLLEVLFEDLFQPDGIAAAIYDKILAFVKKEAGIQEVLRRDEFMPADIGLGVCRHDDAI
jgi:hypothetical protein